MQEQKEKTGPLLADLSDQEAAALCRELREELIRDVSRTGGHLASNLGAVELTVAIHRVFDTSRDRLVFDVGHQCYIHKMLTGRREEMAGLRQYGGIAGFPKPGESVHDAFIAGHASNSVAVAVGMVQARAALGQDYQVAALIGDGALIGHNVVLATLNHARSPHDRGTMIPAPIHIGKNVWIGSNATILPGVTIGDGAIVAAGAVVTRDVPENTIVGGVPARIMRHLSKEELQ